MERIPVLLWEKDAPGATGPGPEDCPRLTSYLLKTGKPDSVVIVCPGGGYAARADHEKEPISLWLNSIGVSSFVLDYRVAPYKYPVQLWDAQRAVRLVRHKAKEFNIDPNRVGMLGFSAAGHLTSMLGTHFDSGKKDDPDPVERQSCRPDLMILCYPVISAGQFIEPGSFSNLLGEKATKDLLDSISSEKQVTADTPPAFIWHTRDDQAVSVENSILFAEALKKFNVAYELHIFESGPHGLGLASDNPSVSAWTKLCEKWLKKQNF